MIRNKNNINRKSIEPHPKRRKLNSNNSNNNINNTNDIK